ncbi:MAG: hypothetical protein JNL32_11890, partial [Candidatus Kapabacteria bacterium]|nr:hypothetical protein [Candidatus Kapabacteria bacterium]
MEIPKGGILWDMLSDLVKRRIERGEGGGSTVSVSQSDSQMQQIAASVHAVATANYTASGTGTSIDGITPVAGRLYLLAAQTDAKLNGIYECSDGFWVRRTLTVGMIVTVRAGTLFAGTVWTMTAPTSSLTIGTDAITFMLHSSRITGADGALQLRDNATGKLKSLAEFFINSTTKVLSGFRAIFSSDFGDTITATSTHNTTSTSAIVANAANATGVKVIAKVPFDITGTGISTMTASGALQYTFDVSIDSSQVDSHVVRMLNITSDTRRAHGLYLSGNGHADSRGLTCVGAQITKLLWVNGRLQLNSRYEESASASLHDYNTSDRSSIEFKGIVGAQTLTGIVAGA